MKAFVITDDVSGQKVVIFDDYQVAARRKGADALGAEFSDVSIDRLEVLDPYAPGPIPKELLIELGLRQDEPRTKAVHDALREEIKLKRATRKPATKKG